MDTNRATHAEYIEAKRQEAVDVCEKLLSDELPVLLGVRRIVDLSDALEELVATQLLDPFKAIDSEADGLPIGKERKYWATQALKNADAKIESYSDLARSAVVDACSLLKQELEQ